MLLHVFAHINADDGVFIVKHGFAQRPAQFGLANAGGPQKNEGTDRAFRILQTRSGPAKGPADSADGFVLTDHPLVEQLLHVQQSLTFVFRHFFDRDARPAGNDLGDVFFGDYIVGRTLALLPRSPLLRHFFLQGSFFVPQAGSFFKVLMSDGFFFFILQRFQPFLLLLHIRRRRKTVQPNAGGGLVHQVDGFIRQKTVGNIAIGQADGGLQRFIGNLDLVMRLIAIPKPFQNSQRFQQ